MRSAAQAVTAGGGRQAHQQRSFSSSPNALLQLSALRRFLSARWPTKEWMLACVHMRAHVGAMLSASPASPHALFSHVFSCWSLLPPVSIFPLRCGCCVATLSTLSLTASRFVLRPFAFVSCTRRRVLRVPVPLNWLAAPKSCSDCSLPSHVVARGSCCFSVSVALLVQLRCLALAGLRLCGDRAMPWRFVVRCFSRLRGGPLSATRTNPLTHTQKKKH